MTRAAANPEVSTAPDSSGEVRRQDQTDEALPGVFLMIDSLQTGGSERQFVALSRSLDTTRFRVELGCIQTKGAMMEESAAAKLARFPLGGSMYGLQSWRTRLNLWRHLRRKKIAIAHAFDFYTNLTLIPPARMAGVPVVIGSHRQLGDLLTPAQWRAQLLVFRRCDAVVCNSRAAADRLIHAGVDEAKIAVIWNGLPDSAFEAVDPAIPPRPGWKRVGMVARMNSAAKQHVMLLHAAARLLGGGTKAEFVFVGDGPLRGELERKATELRIADRVLFLGDRRDVPAILASLDLTVLPSTSESLSNAVIEAMAAGVPVVAADVGGNSELISEERGALVPVGDVERLAAEIRRLLDNDEVRNRMRSQCREFARQHFRLDQMARRQERLYTDLLARKDKKFSGSQGKGKNQ